MIKNDDSVSYIKYHIDDLKKAKEMPKGKKLNIWLLVVNIVGILLFAACVMVGWIGAFFVWIPIALWWRWADAKITARWIYQKIHFEELDRRNNVIAFHPEQADWPVWSDEMIALRAYNRATARNFITGSYPVMDERLGRKPINFTEATRDLETDEFHTF